MFLFYINDLPNITNLARFVLFADDTTCLIPCSHNLNISNHINKITSAISYWFSINCLALNLVKCKCIYFNLRKLVKAELPVIFIDNHIIEIVSSVKFLGCYVDTELNWSDHITNVCFKMSKGIAMLRYIKTYPTFVKKMLYFAYIYPHMIYCLPAWCGTFNVYLERINLLQKKTIRLIANASYLAHTAPIAKLCKLLLFNDVCIVKASKLMHSVFYKHDFVKFQLTHNIFVHEVINYNMRNSFNFPVSFCRTACRKRSVFINGIKIWNSLSIDFRKEPNILNFTVNLSELLIDLY
jgi:hypothetical protein